MRIAMVSEHASPLATLGGVDAGGQNVHVAALAEHLARRGHEVTVFTRRDRTDLAERVDTGRGYAVEHVAAGPPDEVPKDEMWKLMGAFGQDLAPRLLRGGFDLVHTHFWMGAWATLAALRTAGLDGVPVAHTYHALGVVKKRHQGAADTSPADRLDVERQIGHAVDEVIATARDEVRELADLGVDVNRCSVVPCGVDTQLFAPRDLLRPVQGDPGAKEATHRLLVLGRLVERKGIADVIAALAMLPGAELVIAGGPPHAALALDPEVVRLGRVAVEHGVADRVRLVGNLPHERVPRLANSCDVVVSVPWYEPFGIVPLEAMACGRPVVGSAVGGLLDSVDPGVTGELVPPRDPATLAATLGALLADPERRRRYGEAGVRRVRELFDWSQVAERTELVYEQVCRRAAAEGVRRRQEVAR